MGNEESPCTVEPGVPRNRGIKPLLLFAAIAGVCLALSCFTPLREYITVANISRLAQALGFWGPLLLLLLGIITPLLFLPRWPIAFVAGMVYGIGWGSALANVASTLGAYLHFLLAKSLLRHWGTKLARRYAVDARAIPQEHAFLGLFLLRAFPLSNFVATNLLAGALNMKARTYLGATFFGMIPATIMYAAWGKVMKKPDAEFYWLAILLLVALTIGTLVAQKRFNIWMKSKKEPVTGTDQAPGTPKTRV